MKPPLTDALLRRPLARAALLLGAVGVGGSLYATLPHEQHLVFHLPTSTVRLSVVWTRAGEDEPRGGVTLAQPEGLGQTVRQIASLPDGLYEFDAELTRDLEFSIERARSPQTTRALSVTLHGGETVIRLAEQDQE